MKQMHLHTAEVTGFGGYSRLVSRVDVPAGGTVFTCAPEERVAERTFRTIEIGFGRHLANPLVDFMNHSCHPNAVLDVDRLAFRALRDVRAGDELTFFYPGSETELAREFECHCGAPHCVRRVFGALAMPVATMRWAVEQGYCTRFIEAELRRHHARQVHRPPIRWTAMGSGVGESGSRSSRLA